MSPQGSIYWKIPLPPGKYQPMSFGGKREKKKVEIVREKGRKGMGKEM
jgi:hypothetical protein